ncbi:MAG: transglutaminase family protein [Armatimonadetes bacterium]|nr:transglutaminase family protein [Armatimonadota bacterium]
MSTRRVVIAVLIALLCIGVTSVSADLTLEDLAHLGRKCRVLVRVDFTAPLTQSDIRELRNLHLRPAGAGMGGLVGRQTALFQTEAPNALSLERDPRIKAVEWIPEYSVAAHYRVYFRYEGEAAAPELTFTIATPRSATGRELEDLTISVTPPIEYSLVTDAADNQFLTAAFADVQPGQDIRFDFEARYRYDSGAIVEGSVLVMDRIPMPASWPGEVQPFLQPGFHIESDAPEIVALAEKLATSDLLDERVGAILRLVGANIKYDTEKRDSYFGGKYVYNDAWEMWQGALGTLRRGMGCCPDTAELKTALLRAAGIPARTAVHSGHLYAEIWAPGHGWLTDAPHYNVPVIRSPGADNTAYFAWTPAVPVRCVSWGGKMRVPADGASAADTPNRN